MAMSTIDVLWEYLENGCDIITSGLFLNKNSVDIVHDSGLPYTLKPTAFRLVNTTMLDLMDEIPYKKGQRVLAAESSIVFINRQEALILTDTHIPPPHNSGNVLLYVNMANSTNVDSMLYETFRKFSFKHGYSPKGLFGNEDENNASLNSVMG